ncbi:putative transposase-like protein [Cardamine amara subsp. amara]|uniref:Transposase-like protein n=1 Tax=Cardamine amara subsp. amara TaxID=228776 RepID=A0ABD1AKF7_CARAN
MRSPIIIGGRSYWRTLGPQAADLQRPPSPRLPNSQDENIEPHEQPEELAPVHRDVRVLHPSRMNGAKWFKNNTEVSTRVRKIIEGDFKGPWYSWKKVPQFYRDTWFSTFKTFFEWDASIENLVKANFDALAATRLKGMVSLAKSDFKKKGEKPEWILEKFWTIMEAYWKTPKAKDKSEKARASRLSKRGGLGAHCHRAGSRSYVKVQDVLKANNEDSSFIAVMRKTHQKSDGTFVDEKARLISEKYDEYMLQRLAHIESSNADVLTMEPLTIEEKNEIYVKVAEISKQGRVFGVGSLQNEVPMTLDGSPVFTQATEQVETFNVRVTELETKLQRSRDETLLFQKRLETMEKILLSGSAGPSASTPSGGTSTSSQVPMG